jgi:hypothetical protein
VDPESPPVLPLPAAVPPELELLVSACLEGSQAIAASSAARPKRRRVKERMSTT